MHHALAVAKLRNCPASLCCALTLPAYRLSASTAVGEYMKYVCFVCVLDAAEEEGSGEWSAMQWNGMECNGMECNAM